MLNVEFKGRNKTEELMVSQEIVKHLENWDKQEDTSKDMADLSNT